MDRLEITDVFSPSGIPSYTYVNRTSDKHAASSTYEEKLKRALKRTGNLIYISGGSKTGKTVLYRKVVEQDRLIELSGAQIQSQEDFWQQIAERLSIPYEIQTALTKQEIEGSKKSFSGRASALSLLSGGLESEETTSQAKGENITKRIVRSNILITKLLIEGQFVLVIDDFHYIRSEVQLYLARILKTELINGLKVIVLSLPHRTDEAIRLNPDLIGRTSFIELDPWSRRDLEEIARKGFPLLGVDISETVLRKIAEESALSPQLMQENCLNLAYGIEHDESGSSVDELLLKAFSDTVEEYQHYGDIVEKILKGPAKGRSRRKQYRIRQNGTYDVYRLLLMGIVADPPILELAIDELMRRMTHILEDGESPPSKLGLSKIVNHIEEILKDELPELDTMEWKNSVLYVLDPFLLFYLRWNASWRE